MVGKPVEQHLEWIRCCCAKCDTQRLKGLQHVALDGDRQPIRGLRARIKPVGIAQQLKHGLKQGQTLARNQAITRPAAGGIQTKTNPMGWSGEHRAVLVLGLCQQQRRAARLQDQRGVSTIEINGQGTLNKQQQPRALLVKRQVQPLSAQITLFAEDNGPQCKG